MVGGERRDFSCRDEDKLGSPLTDQEISFDNNGAGDIIVICSYERAGDCKYLANGDGSLLSGSTACPGSSEQSSPTITIPTHPQTSTRIATSTQIRSSSVTSALTTSQAAPEAPVSSSSIVSSATISSLPPPTATQTIFSSPKPLSVGAIAGIVISIVTALAAILFLCICAQRARKRRRASTIAPEPYPTPGMPAQSLTLMPFSALVPGQPTARPPEARKGFREALVRIGITGPATMAQLERAVQQNAALRERIRVLEGETQRHTPSQSGPDSSSPPAYYIGTPTLR